MNVSSLHIILWVFYATVAVVTYTLHLTLYTNHEKGQYTFYYCTCEKSRGNSVEITENPVLKVLSVSYWTHRNLQILIVTSERVGIIRIHPKRKTVSKLPSRGK